MGNTHSAPGTYAERNKLSKPRVGNARRDALSFARSPASVTGKFGKRRASETQLENPPNPRRQSLQDAPNASQSSRITERTPTPSKDTRTRRSSSVTGYPDTSPLIRYASHRSSAIGTPASQSFMNGHDHGNGSDILMDSQASVTMLRRRSQIFAAPPATITRRQTLTIPDLHVRTQASGLIALDPPDADRAQTPSGYSVLGGFKRGSLRIVNQTSPGPSTPDSRPRRRNTSPAHHGTALSMIVATPAVENSSHGGESYFDFNPRITASKGVMSCTEIPKLLSVDTSQPESMSAADTPFSYETAQENASVHEADAPGLILAQSSTADQNAAGSDSNLAEVNLNLVQRRNTCSGQGSMDIGSDGARDRAIQRAITEGSPVHHKSPADYSAEKYVSTYADPTTIRRSLSNTSSIYSNPQSIPHYLILHPQNFTEEPNEILSGYPSVKTGIDSGYGSVSSWRSSSWRSWSRGTSRSRKGPKENVERPAVAEPKVEVIVHAESISEPPLRSTDKYRLSATLQGPVIEIPATTNHMRKPSLPTPYEPYLSRKRSIGQRLRAAVSNGDLKCSTIQGQRKDQDDLTVALWQSEICNVQQQLRHSKSFDAGSPNRYRSAGALTPTQRYHQKYVMGSSERAISVASPNTSHPTGRLQHSQSLSQLNSQVYKRYSTAREYRSTTGVDYHQRFAKRRDTRQTHCGPAIYRRHQSSSPSLYQIAGK